MQFNQVQQSSTAKCEKALGTECFFKVLMYCIWILAMPEFSFFSYIEHDVTFYVALISFQKVQLFLFLFILEMSNKITLKMFKSA